MDTYTAKTYTQSGRLDALARLALADAGSELALQAKASALVKLVAAGESSGVPRDRLRVELQRIAETEAISARGLQGVLAALRALEHLDASPFAWPHPEPDAVVVPPWSYWPWWTREAWDAAPQSDAFRKLDAETAGYNTFGHRDRERARLEGPPPWPR